MSARNIAIFGGSFDPFHNGHFALLQKVLAKFHFSQLFLTPTFCSPFKEGSFFSPNDRLQMCAIVARELGSKNCEIVACDFEVAQKRVVYSIELVEYVKNIAESTESKKPKNVEYARATQWSGGEAEFTSAKVIPINGIDLKEFKFFFILGLDSFASLHRWHKFEKLCAEVEFIVCDRADSQNFQTTLQNLENPSNQKDAEYERERKRGGGEAEFTSAKTIQFKGIDSKNPQTALKNLTSSSIKNGAICARNAVERRRSAIHSHETIQFKGIDSQNFQTTLQNLQQAQIPFTTLCARLQIPHLRAHFLEFDSHLSSTQLRAELQKSLESHQLDSVLKQIPSCLHSFVKEILLRKEFAK
ncbi:MULTISPECIES: nicotinate-nicotinamide nucleotide adenylyltransferase [unclassified Helicobacter]|uniref:nicotinate-nicotinamide nucleotide adenylyltransferase n=1 Tax=unclassified Helicobacter TaxID=2593540 RepID=UPI0015F12A2C|nr:MULTISPECIES: nicotinate-nicotinamide nucleotide adenylyltransferase [unclassified Helicobacter]